MWRQQVTEEDVGQSKVYLESRTLRERERDTERETETETERDRHYSMSSETPNLSKF